MANYISCNCDTKNSGGGDGQPTQITNTDGILDITGSGSYNVNIDVNEDGIKDIVNDGIEDGSITVKADAERVITQGTESHSQWSLMFSMPLNNESNFNYNGMLELQKIDYATGDLQSPPAYVVGLSFGINVLDGLIRRNNVSIAYETNPICEDIANYIYCETLRDSSLNAISFRVYVNTLGTNDGWLLTVKTPPYSLYTQQKTEYTVYNNNVQNTIPTGTRIAPIDNAKVIESPNNTINIERDCDAILLDINESAIPLPEEYVKSVGSLDESVTVVNSDGSVDLSIPLKSLVSDDNSILTTNSQLIESFQVNYPIVFSKIGSSDGSIKPTIDSSGNLDLVAIKEGVRNPDHGSASGIYNEDVGLCMIETTLPGSPTTNITGTIVADGIVNFVSFNNPAVDSGMFEFKLIAHIVSSDIGSGSMLFITDRTPKSTTIDIINMFSAITPVIDGVAQKKIQISCRIPNNTYQVYMQFTHEPTIQYSSILSYKAPLKFDYLTNYTWSGGTDNFQVIPSMLDYPV